MRWIGLLCLVAGCSGPLELAVDLRTDYVPGLEVDAARVSWERVGGQGIGADTVALEGRDLVAGARLVDVRDLEPGAIDVIVTLLRGGVEIASRRTRLEVRDHTAVTVVLTRDCEGVACEGASSECVDGRCVPPECQPDAPERCGPASCAAADDCEAPAVSCLQARCVSRVCLEVPDDGLCEGRCDPTLGCGGEPPPPDDAGAGDAGGCAAREAFCNDGADDDCDGLTDCADPDCADALCDDGDLCTHTDRCAAGVCAGTAIDCASDACVTRACNGTPTCDEAPMADGTACPDDGNACTNDRCMGGTCAHPARADGTACPDDGNACTTDRCMGGTCAHPARADGTGLGGFRRCCGGREVDVSTNRNHCGACGLSCASGFSCTVYSGQPTCDCGAANSQCQGGVDWVCSTTYGVCACLSGGCPAGSRCVARSGPDYCTY
ncbi:MAG: hypothetical protein VYE22_25570 [Myxococcota bacterium]|nr:hypothetical protein [Myxococcota bacterium]